MSLRSYTVECEADVDLLDAVDSLADQERQQLLDHLLKTKSPTDTPVTELARRLAAAVEQRDDKAVADLLHRLCMDLAGYPVVNPVHVGPAPWQHQVTA